MAIRFYSDPIKPVAGDDCNKDVILRIALYPPTMWLQVADFRFSEKFQRSWCLSAYFFGFNAVQNPHLVGMDKPMFGLLSSKKKRLEKKYALLLDESYKLSHRDRKASDLKMAEANRVLEQIKGLEMSSNQSDT
ncbi:MAG: Lacal_2735 family protein [Lacipirellulaceae bacterium]